MTSSRRPADVASSMVMPNLEVVRAERARDGRFEEIEIRDLAYLGSGAYSNVYKGSMVLDGEIRIVVLKKTFRDPRRRLAFETEEDAVLRGLDSKYTIRLLYLFTRKHEDGIMVNAHIFEYMHSNLGEYIRERRRLSPLEVKIFAWQLFAGLAYLERKGIRHRDIKPTNLLVDPASALLRIADFGSATMAPFEATHYSCTVDVWSAGCVFAEMACGHIAFAGLNKHHQLQILIQALGMPNQWEAHYMHAPYGKYKAVYHAYIAQPRLGLRTFLAGADETSIGLLEQILVYTPQNRLRGRVLLENSYFTELFTGRVKLASGRRLDCVTREDLDAV